MKFTKNKVVIIGTGMVGSATLNALLQLDLIAEIVLIDSNRDKAKGEALDASHTTSFAYSPNVNIREGDYEECEDAQIIIFTAGPSIKPDQIKTVDDRLRLAKINIQVLTEAMNELMKYTKDSIIIIVSNPLDILTYYAQNKFGYDENKIIGTGTLLDTARFRRMLALQYNIDAKNVHGYILGEHGNTAFATWSLVNIAGIPINDLNSILDISEELDKDKILDKVKTIGFDILKLKGYTNMGVAYSISRLVKAIILNELSVLPISTTLHGEYGISDIALSIPCVISKNGVEKKIEVPLDDKEMIYLQNSADYLKKNLEVI